MDKIEELAKQASQLTFYDVKSYYNQARNAILNVSPMEAKVREATDPDEAWGASSTLMQEIAQATHNFQHFNEILPLIWSRFHESEASQWRQIYKALTLLEYLVKNGSERVVDDARSHISTVKMLRNFQYIDEKGKDQGINVRNRAKEINDLLSDVERIRVERRRAKSNKNKYGGTGSDGSGGGFSGGSGGFGGSGSRYGGFGSESGSRYDSQDRGGYGGSSGGSGRHNDHDSGDVYRSSGGGQKTEFDEYDAGDDDDRVPTPRSRAPLPPRSGHSSKASSISRAPAPVVKPTKPAPVVQDLFDFGQDDTVPQASPAAPPVPAKNMFDDDDDFADFQGASAITAPAPAPIAHSIPAPKNVFDFLDAAPPTYTLPATNGLPSRPSQTSNNTYQPTPAQPKAQPAAVAAKPVSGFDDLWSTSLTAVGGTAPSSGNSASNKSMLDLDREKTMNNLWAAPGMTNKPYSGVSKGAFDDLLG